MNQQYSAIFAFDVFHFLVLLAVRKHLLTGISYGNNALDIQIIRKANQRRNVVPCDGFLYGGNLRSAFLVCSIV